MKAYKYFFFFSIVIFSVGCGFFGKEFDEAWLKNNVVNLNQVAKQALSIDGLSSVSGKNLYKDNAFKRFQVPPSASDIDNYNNLHKQLKKLNVKSLSVATNERSVSFVLYDSGVYGEAYQSVVYSERSEISTELTTPEVFSCKQSIYDLWFICEGKQ